jgi:hypothetical protein
MSYAASSDQSCRFECSARSTQVLLKSALVGVRVRVRVRVRDGLGLRLGLGLGEQYLGSAFQDSLERHVRPPCNTVRVPHVLICKDSAGKPPHFPQASLSRLLCGNWMRVRCRLRLNLG